MKKKFILFLICYQVVESCCLAGSSCGHYERERAHFLKKKAECFYKYNRKHVKSTKTLGSETPENDFSLLYQEIKKDISAEENPDTITRKQRKLVGKQSALFSFFFLSILAAQATATPFPEGSSVGYKKNETGLKLNQVFKNSTTLAVPFPSYISKKNVCASYRFGGGLSQMGLSSEKAKFSVINFRARSIRSYLISFFGAFDLTEKTAQLLTQNASFIYGWTHPDWPESCCEFYSENGLKRAIEVPFKTSKDFGSIVTKEIRRSFQKFETNNPHLLIPSLEFQERAKQSIKIERAVILTENKENSLAKTWGSPTPVQNNLGVIERILEPGLIDFVRLQQSNNTIEHYFRISDQIYWTETVISEKNEPFSEPVNRLFRKIFSPSLLREEDFFSSLGTVSETTSLTDIPSSASTIAPFLTASEPPLVAQSMLVNLPIGLGIGTGIAIIFFTGTIVVNKIFYQRMKQKSYQPHVELKTLIHSV